MNQRLTCLKILGVFLKMYKVTCICGEHEFISLIGRHAFSFEMINELYVHFTCSKCDRRRFNIKFIFKKECSSNDIASLIQARKQTVNLDIESD